MAIGIFSIKKKEEEQEDNIKDQLFAVQMQMRSAKSKFSEVSDTDLSESYIYEINALNARYRYLLKCAKKSITA